MRVSVSGHLPCLLVPSGSVFARDTTARYCGSSAVSMRVQPGSRSPEGTSESARAKVNIVNSIRPEIGSGPAEEKPNAAKRRDLFREMKRTVTSICALCTQGRFYHSTDNIGIDNE